MCLQAAPASHTIPKMMAVITAALPISGCISKITDKVPARINGLSVSKNLERTNSALSREISRKIDHDHDLDGLDHLEVKKSEFEAIGCCHSPCDPIPALAQEAGTAWLSSIIGRLIAFKETR